MLANHMPKLIGTLLLLQKQTRRTGLSVQTPKSPVAGSTMRAQRNVCKGAQPNSGLASHPHNLLIHPRRLNRTPPLSR